MRRPLRLFTVLLLILFASTPAVSLAPPSTAKSAELRVNGRLIAIFRVPLGAQSPRERAAAAKHRINEAIAASPKGPVLIRDDGEGLLILLGTRSVFSLLPGDVDRASEQSLVGLGQSVEAALDQVLSEEHEKHDFRALGIAGAESLGALLLLVLAVWLLVEFRKHAFRIIDGNARHITIRGFTFFRADQLAAFGRFAVGLISWGAGLFTTDLCVTWALTLFPWTRPFGEALGTWLAHTLQRLVLGALQTIPGLVTAAAIFLAARFLTRLVNAFFAGVENGTVTVSWLHPEIALPTRRLTTVLLWVFAIVAAYPYLPGTSSEAFKGLGVFFGLMLSLGSTGVMSQGMSGIVLMYARALRPGDYVKIGEVEGTVLMLGMLSTKVMTIHREEVTIPNSVVVSSPTINYSRFAGGDGMMLYTEVTIGYDVPWRQVHAMLLSAASQVPGLRQEPPPFVVQRSLDDFYVAYQLNIYCEQPQQRMFLLSKLHAAIQDAFNEHGVQILSPHFVANPPQPAVVPPERWYASPARPEAKDGATEPEPARPGETRKTA